MQIHANLCTRVVQMLGRLVVEGQGDVISDLCSFVIICVFFTRWSGV